jgi:inhibitor of cysteine peptidase
MSRLAYLAFILLGIVVIGTIITSAIFNEGGNTETYEGLQKFASTEEIAAFLRDYTITGGYQYGPVDMIAEERVMAEAGTPAPLAKNGMSLQSSETADRYSTTNVQVEGVDEADFVKNDAKFIYLVTGETLTIVDAYPAEDAKIISRTWIEGTPVAIFVNKNRLVVFVSRQSNPEPPNPGLWRGWRETTHALVYSLADRTRPELVRDITFSGSYAGSRMIGDDVYLITAESVWYAEDDVIVPFVREDGGALHELDVYHTDIPEYRFLYHTVSSFNIQKDAGVTAKSFLLGYSTTIYASRENLYIAYLNTHPVYREGAIREKSSGIEDNTMIHKFRLKSGDIQHAALGEVPGRLLNQFSLDEYNGHLRVATTVAGWTPYESYQYSRITVLDNNMEGIGALKYIAPGEQIYAARFAGDRLYLVTFKRIDPFFVIDLSDPRNPAILGELKIPGFSDYLHPYDEKHVIGIGKETESNEWGGVSVAGLKIALFDVSDVNNPKQVDTLEIGEAGSDSEALRDHKAILFDRKKNLLVLPVREVQRIPVDTKSYPSYSQKLWQGAYVLSINPKEGISIAGCVSHDPDDDYGSWWGSPSAVRRSLFMDDVLYTISSQKIVMSDLDAVDHTLGEILLPGGGYSPPLHPLME